MSPPLALWRTRLMISLSFVAALLLAVYPLVEWNIYRPQLVALLVIYWALAIPQQLSVLMVWLVGLLQDLVEGSLLGLHALSLVLLAYLCLLSYQRIRNFALWQQSCWVFMLIAIHQLLGDWVDSLSGQQSQPFDFLYSALVSALCWPLLYSLLQGVGRRLRLF